MSLLISTHSPRVGRDWNMLQSLLYRAISTHSPRVGRDILNKLQGFGFGEISTHSPRVGRDLTVIVRVWVPGNFNPLSPCGERPRRYSLQSVQ